MSIGVVSKSKDAVTVRLPRDIDIPEGEVEITRQGDDVVLSPKKPSGDMMKFVELLRELPDDMFDAIAEARQQDRRSGP